MATIECYEAGNLAIALDDGEMAEARRIAFERQVESVAGGFVARGEGSIETNFMGAKGEIAFKAWLDMLGVSCEVNIESGNVGNHDFVVNGVSIGIKTSTNVRHYGTALYPMRDNIPDFVVFGETAKPDARDPSGFVQHANEKWSRNDVVIFIGCARREDILAAPHSAANVKYPAKKIRLVNLPMLNELPFWRNLKLEARV